MKNQTSPKWMTGSKYLSKGNFATKEMSLENPSYCTLF